MGRASELSKIVELDGVILAADSLAGNILTELYIAEKQPSISGSDLKDAINKVLSPFDGSCFVVGDQVNFSVGKGKGITMEALAQIRSLIQGMTPNAKVLVGANRDGLQGRGGNVSSKGFNY